MEGWWNDSAGKQDKEYIKEYLGLEEVTDISWTMLREALKSVSRTTIVMMQVVSASAPPAGSSTPTPYCIPFLLVSRPS